MPLRFYRDPPSEVESESGERATMDREREERDISRELEEKRQELEKKGKPTHIGRPYDTSREAVEEGERKRTGTNLDIGEERSEEQKREMQRWLPEEGDEEES